MPGSALVVVSRGLVEVDRLEENSEVTEFGLDGVQRSLQDTNVLGAHDLCLSVLRAAREFTPATVTQNDLTALALVRNASRGVA